MWEYYAKRWKQTAESRIRSVMKASLLKIQPVRVAVVEGDPLRFVGLRTCLGSESDFELSSTSLSEAGTLQNIDLVLLGNHIGSNLFEVVATLKAARPGLRIIVMGVGMEEENILKAIASGAMGYIDEAANPTEFAQALRVVSHGSVWAPRRVLSLFVERVRTHPDVSSLLAGCVLRTAKKRFWKCCSRADPTRKSVLPWGS